jgi:peroxiredoxin
MIHRPSAARVATLGLLLTVGTAVVASAQNPAGDAPPLTGTQLRNLPAPEFQLPTLAGGSASLDPYEGWILVLHFFDGESEESSRLLREMTFFHSQGREHEIAYLGISTASKDKTASLARQEDVKYELALDADGAVTRRYLGTKRMGVIIIDHRGTVRFIHEGFPVGIRESTRGMLSRLLQELRQALASLPRKEIPWRALPVVPVFSGVDLEGRSHTYEQYRGKPLAVYFLERECEFCGEMATPLSEVFFRYRDRIQFLGVATGDPEGDLKRHMTIQGLGFPVLLDPDRAIRRAFGSQRGSPDLFWVDSEGQVRWREFGTVDNAAYLLDLQARALLGIADPEDLSPDEYVGYRTCRVCHEAELRDWLETPHATAMITLSTGSGWSQNECLSCHVTGFQKPGGYKDAMSPRMAHVQCEACHGPGGGHGRPAGSPRPSPVSQCLHCHKGEYELQQDLQVSVSWMDHQDTPDSATLFGYLPERIPEMQEAAETRLVTLTLRPGTEYTGSESCAPCHTAIFEHWKTSRHGLALDTLQAAGKHKDRRCLVCHTTAYAELSGYRGTSTPALAGVGCESCHGPGADHVAAARKATASSIYGLATDCAHCRAEAVCRACHDSENDPDFRMPEDVLRTIHPAKP